MDEDGVAFDQLDSAEDGMVRLTGTIAERVYVGTATQVIVEQVTVAWRPEHSLVLR